MEREEKSKLWMIRCITLLLNIKQYIRKEFRAWALLITINKFHYELRSILTLRYVMNALNQFLTCFLLQLSLHGK